MMLFWDQTAFFLGVAGVVCFAASLTFASCRLLMPVLQRYALARPNARSSHVIPTPQGGGIAILIGLVVSVAALALLGALPMSPALLILLMATLALGLLGGIDDIRPLPASLRLLVQALAVTAVILTMPVLQILPWPHFPHVPSWFGLLNLAILVLAGIWFVNLTNFMDGLDWLTIAAFMPATAFLALLGGLNLLDATPALIAAALCGALIGFAPLNKPVARLFLGDVGSLPIGLVIAWLLYRLASQIPGSIYGGMTAAFLLPLYHVTDATLTLFQRLRRGERVWQAHRNHAYQRATDNGFSVLSVALHVLGLNCVLCALALICLLFTSLAVNLGCFMLGLALTMLMIRRFTSSQGFATQDNSEKNT